MFSTPALRSWGGAGGGPSSSASASKRQKRTLSRADAARAPPSGGGRGGPRLRLRRAPTNPTKNETQPEPLLRGGGQGGAQYGCEAALRNCSPFASKKQNGHNKYYCVSQRAQQAQKKDIPHRPHNISINLSLSKDYKAPHLHTPPQRENKYQI